MFLYFLYVLFLTVSFILFSYINCLNDQSTLRTSWEFTKIGNIRWLVIINLHTIQYQYINMYQQIQSPKTKKKKKKTFILVLHASNSKSRIKPFHSPSLNSSWSPLNIDMIFSKRLLYVVKFPLVTSQYLDYIYLLLFFQGY